MDAGTAVGLVADDLWLTRDGREVLRGASLAVPRGYVTALAAPSGAGKSTVLRCMTRLLDADRGTVTLDGRDVRTLAPRELRRRVGLVAQAPAMLPGSVADNVRYGIPGASGAEVHAALAAAGLGDDFAGRDAAALSGGEQARVAIARAVALDPEVLLLDEPTAALDAVTAALIGETLRALAARGIGLGLAVHDLAFADRYADRVAHLERAA